jgi:nitroimidazol reductase NimA-like FMN-containing flavoprotein (pyridoxamine 5'-phosphate oxidase superfamily)
MTINESARSDDLPLTERTTVHRYAELQTTSREDLHRVLDEGLVAHIGFQGKGGPVVIPMAYARDGDYLYLHGSTGSGLGLSGSAGADLAVTVTIVDGLVYASNLYDSTFNYRCAMIFGTSEPVSDEERYHAVKMISGRLMPGRWDEVREPLPKELAATKVLKLPLAQASCKISSGPPDTDPQPGLWTGEVPVVTRAGRPVTQDGANPELPPSVTDAIKALGGTAPAR